MGCHNAFIDANPHVYIIIIFKGTGLGLLSEQISSNNCYLTRL